MPVDLLEAIKIYEHAMDISLNDAVIRAVSDGSKGCDPAVKGALVEIETMRRFAGVELYRVPAESSILHFRHLLEPHDLGSAIFKTVNDHLAQRDGC